MKWTLMMVLAVGALVAGVGGWAWAGEGEGGDRPEGESARSGEGESQGPAAPAPESLEATVCRMVERLDRLERIVAELTEENAQLRQELSAQGKSADRGRGEREEGQKTESGEREQTGDRPRDKQEGGEEKPRREGADVGVAGAVPVGLRGFRGQVAGTVVRVGDRGFVVKVEKVLNVWEGNKAREPQSAVGKNLAAVLGPNESASGNHMAVLRKLVVGNRVVVELVHDGGDVLRIVEQFRIEG